MTATYAALHLHDGAERRGYIHLLQAGSVTLLGPDRKDLQLTRPNFATPRQASIVCG
jgi:hypothetical protein